jgi:hypothetical protein
MTIDELVRLGHYHLCALAKTEQTKALVSGFARVLDALEGAAETARRAKRALMRANVPALFAETDMREVITHVAAIARTSDRAAREGGRAVYQALFPNGLEVELSPQGAARVAVAIALRARLVSHPAVVDVKAQVIGDFDKALATLIAALAARQLAENEAIRTRELAEHARAQFLAGYERDAEAIAKLFPANPLRQDLYFEERDIDENLMACEAEWWPSVGRKDDGKPS